MEAGYTGLPAEHKNAKEALMRSHERAYNDVRRHALAGTNQDFDMPLTNGEREHQRHLRTQEGLTEKDVREIRENIRNANSSQDTGISAGPRTARAAGAAGLSAIDAATTGKGSLILQLAGVLITLSLIYLLVAGKGTNALRGITNLIVGAARTFIAPVDPIAKLESSLGATPISTSSPAGDSGGAMAPSSGGSSGSSPDGSSVGGSGPSAWRSHLAPDPSKIKVRASSPAAVEAFEKATGAHFTYGSGAVRRRAATPHTRTHSTGPLHAPSPLVFGVG